MWSAPLFTVSKETFCTEKMKFMTISTVFTMNMKFSIKFNEWEAATENSRQGTVNVTSILFVHRQFQLIPCNSVLIEHCNARIHKSH